MVRFTCFIYSFHGLDVLWRGAEERERERLTIQLLRSANSKQLLKRANSIITNFLSFYFLFWYEKNTMLT